MAERDIPGSVIAYVADVDIVAFRSYRTPHGYLNPFGELSGNAYVYSRGEAVKIAVAIALGRTGLGLREAFAVISEADHPIQRAFVLPPWSQEQLVCRFHRNRKGIYSSAMHLTFDAGAAVRMAETRLHEALARDKSNSSAARWSHDAPMRSVIG